VGALPVAVAAEVTEMIRIIAAAAKAAATSNKKTLNEIGIDVSCIINNPFLSNKAQFGTFAPRVKRSRLVRLGF
jgi:hypothetical protein